MNVEALQLKQGLAVAEARTIVDNAEKEGRGLTPEEKKECGTLLQSVDALDTKIAKSQGDVAFFSELDRLAGGSHTSDGRAGGRFVVSRVGDGKSIGQELVDSAVGKYLVETKGARSGAWRSPQVELKAVLLEDGLIQPQVLPAVPSPTRPVVMSELFAIGPTNSNAILYMEETLYTSAAAPVAEGATKPESTLTFANKTSRVEKIAHWLPVSDEFLEDEPGLRSYVDQRLRLGVMIELDDQILNGSGVSPELNGLLVRTDLTPPLPVGTASGPDAIAAQIAQVEAASQLAVDGIVLNPSDWLKFGLMKTTQGEYLGANPFDAPQVATLWGRRVAMTPAMPAGTALVGAFRSGGGQLFQRGGLRVEASNSHQDYFIKNLTAIRAEIRVALVLVRPVAFGKVTGLNPPV